MDKESIQKALKTLKDGAKKRNFTQSVDLVINLKNIDLKREKVNFFLNVAETTGKSRKICALVDGELKDAAVDVFDDVISADEFSKYMKDKKAVKALARKYDFFVAQAQVMTKVAATFGRQFGPLGKMPNPQAGSVITPQSNLQATYDKLQRTVKLACKSQPIIQVLVGMEDTSEDIVVDNILTIYNFLVSHLAQGENNIKKGLIKLTMSQAVEVF